MPTLLHFTAAWAEAICGPHRQEVAEAASTLGWPVREVDIDAEPEVCRSYGVLNVPAVAAEGQQGPPIVGAFPAEQLILRLRDMR